ncbi:MAG: transposase [Clostridia bacterium]|nr:transposase [Clostridia bacterium]
MDRKYELHVHTAECDPYATLSGAEIVRRYHDAGYHGIVITDHYFDLFHQWFQEELCDCHQTIMDRYLRGYYAARNEGEKIGLTVLPGAEVRLDSCPNDYLIYGLEADDFYRLPLLHRQENLSALIATLPKDVCVVQAHPFRNNMSVQNPAPLFGLEVYNSHTESFRNELAHRYAVHYDKAMTSGSDFHSENDTAKGGILTDQVIASPKDLISVLRSGNYRLVQNT